MSSQADGAIMKATMALRNAADVQSQLAMMLRVRARHRMSR